MKEDDFKYRTDVLNKGKESANDLHIKRVMNTGEAFVKYLQGLNNKPLEYNLIISLINGLSKVSEAIIDNIKQENKDE